MADEDDEARLICQLQAGIWNAMAAGVDRRDRTGDEWWFDIADRLARVRSVVLERYPEQDPRSG